MQAKKRLMPQRQLDLITSGEGWQAGRRRGRGSWESVRPGMARQLHVLNPDFRHHPWFTSARDERVASNVASNPDVL